MNKIFYVFLILLIFTKRGLSCERIDDDTSISLRSSIDQTYQHNNEELNEAPPPTPIVYPPPEVYIGLEHEEKQEGGVVQSFPSYWKASWDTFKFCFPYLVAKVPLALNGLSDAYLYGRLGGNSLVSEPMALTWRYLIMGTAMGGLRTSTIQAGQLNSFDDETIELSALSNVNKVGLLVAGSYALLVLPLLLESGNIARATGIIGNVAIINELQSYFIGFFWGVPAALCLYADEQFSLGLKDNKIPLIYGTIFPALSMALSYPLTLGWQSLGIPSLGVQGMGHATSIAAWLSWAALRIHYQCSHKYRQLGLYNFRSINKACIKEYLLDFIPLSIVNTIISAKDYAFSQFITGKGTTYARSYASSSVYFEYVTSHFGVIHLQLFHS